MIVLREIKKYPKSTGFLIKKLPFQRLTRKIESEYTNELKIPIKCSPCSSRGI